MALGTPSYVAQSSCVCPLSPESLSWMPEAGASGCNFYGRHPRTRTAQPNSPVPPNPHLLHNHYNHIICVRSGESPSTQITPLKHQAAQDAPEDAPETYKIRAIYLFVEYTYFMTFPLVATMARVLVIVDDDDTGSRGTATMATTAAAARMPRTSPVPPARRRNSV
jgi:hypothetical protein